MSHVRRIGTLLCYMVRYDNFGCACQCCMCLKNSDRRDTCILMLSLIVHTFLTQENVSIFFVLLLHLSLLVFLEISIIMLFIDIDIFATAFSIQPVSIVTCLVLCVYVGSILD